MSTVILNPNGDVITQWTPNPPHYSLVNSGVDTPDWNTVISASAIDKTDEFEIEDPPTDLETATSVEVDLAFAGDSDFFFTSGLQIELVVNGQVIASAGKNTDTGGAQKRGKVVFSGLDLSNNDVKALRARFKSTNGDNLPGIQIY